MSRIEKFKETKDTWAYGGEYHPLKYWEILGYNADRIRRTSRPDDIIETDQAGTCYRVRILSAGSQGESGSRQALTYGGTNAPLAIAGPAAPSALAAPEAIEPETRAQFAERMKAEREARKAADKLASAKRVAANQLLKKIAGPLKQLTDVLDLPTIKELNPNLTQKSIAIRVQGETCVNKINASLAGNDVPPPQEVRAAWKAHFHKG